MELGQRIRRARNDRGWTQTELAVKLGVNYRTVQGWETQGRVPRKRLPQIEALFGLDLHSKPESEAPRLDECSDGQLLMELSTRLSKREQTIAALRAG